ncbi:MAG TPA: sulfatase, partial [Planctomycetota bacterium]|nr:sulfatase [Planctomycetota bacterium]
AGVLGGCGGAVSTPASGGSADAPEAADPPVALVQNVVLVSLDTLRADRLDSFGYHRSTAPNLAGLQQRAVMFSRAQAQSGQTAPSHASLLTSTYGETHGIINVHGDAAKMRTLPAGLPTIAEVASRAGIETGAFVSNGNLTRGMGMDRGFSVWDEKNEDIVGRIDACMRWIRDPERGRFLALLHTYQVHAPYVPPREVAERFVDHGYAGPLRARLERYWAMSWGEQWSGGVGADYWGGMLQFTKDDVRFLSDLYDGEIAFADAELRALLQEVLTGPVSTSTALIVLSDHGEEFRDHGKFQHDQLFEEIIHVPLFVSMPVQAGGITWTGDVDAPVELVDVAPTVAEIMGLGAWPPEWEGRSLVPLLDPLRRTAAVDRERVQFSELTLDPGPKQFRTVTWRGWKYIHGYQQDLDATWEWLFDLSRDPGELSSLMQDERPETVEMLANLRERLEAHSQRCREKAAAAGQVEMVTLTEEMRRNLDQLGYVR